MAQLNATKATNLAPQNPHVTVELHVDLTGVAVWFGSSVLML